MSQAQGKPWGGCADLCNGQNPRAPFLAIWAWRQPAIIFLLLKAKALFTPAVQRTQTSLLHSHAGPALPLCTHSHVPLQPSTIQVGRAYLTHAYGWFLSSGVFWNKHRTAKAKCPLNTGLKARRVCAGWRSIIFRSFLEKLLGL